MKFLDDDFNASAGFTSPVVIQIIFTRDAKIASNHIKAQIYQIGKFGMSVISQLWPYQQFWGNLSKLTDKAITGLLLVLNFPIRYI